VGPRLTEKEWHLIVGTYLAKKQTSTYYVDGIQVNANAGVPGKVEQAAEQILFCKEQRALRPMLYALRG